MSLWIFSLPPDLMLSKSRMNICLIFKWKKTLQRFISYLQKYVPLAVSSVFGDSYDWPVRKKINKAEFTSGVRSHLKKITWDADHTLTTELYEKQGHFNFTIVNSPYLCSSILTSPEYGIYIFQKNLICTSVLCIWSVFKWRPAITKQIGVTYVFTV
jgi:hypothetical protein